MYFIHSYHVKLKDEKIETSYSKFNDQKFTSSIKKENIQAFQFHPEKSGKKGLEIYLSLKINMNEAFRKTEAKTIMKNYSKKNL